MTDSTSSAVGALKSSVNINQKSNDKRFSTTIQSTLLLDENDYDTVPEYIEQERYVGSADGNFFL